jgi:hypothetical protein
MVGASAEGSTTLYADLRTMQKQAAEAADEALAGSYLNIKIKLHLSLRKRPQEELVRISSLNQKAQQGSD